MSVTSGSRLGPYEIVSAIGAGGMGEVFRARDTRLERSVAIKILPAELARDAQFRLRLEREAKTISQLNHPHICTLYDVGHENGTDYLVMELIEGEPLAERLARGPLPLDQVVRYGAQIADALDKAHRQGIVHRDLKPANIMVTRSGAKLLDFGLAKPAEEAARGVRHSELTQQKPITEQGMIVGTFQYMAPEQLEGAEADARTDLFALGAVLYEMATGKRAFEGKTRTSLIAAIVSSDPPPIGQTQPLTPPALEHVVRQCLAKDPDERWQSAHDVAAELRWISELGSQAAATPRLASRMRRERLLWIAALVAAIAAAVAWTTRWRSTPESLSYRFLLPQRDGGYSRATWPLLSPDGKQIIFYARGADGKRRLHLRRMDDFSVRTWDVPEGSLGTAFWSPDSSAVAAPGGGELRRFDLRNGSFQTITKVPTAQNGAWSEDGTFLLGSNEGPLLELRPGSMKAIPITKPDPAKFEVGHHQPIFLPGGKRFLFISFTRNPSQPDAPHTLYAGQLGSREIRKVGEVTSKVQYARGHLFYVRGGTLVAVPFDAERLEFRGEPVVVAEDVAFFQPTGAAGFSVAEDGTVACMPRAQANRLVVSDGQGKPVRSVAPEADLRGSFDVSSDGTRVVSSKRDPSTGTFDLWMYGLTRPTATRLTFEAAEERSPVWSHDGSTLYYGSDRKGLPDIYAKALDSAEDDRVVLEGPGDQEPTDISRDGLYLLYTEHRGFTTGADLFALSLRDGRSIPVVRTPANEGAGKFSPDGKWVAYVSEASGRAEVFVKAFPGPGAERQVSTAGGILPQWSHDGRSIYYRAGTDTIVRVDIDPSGTLSDPRPLFTHRGEITGFEVLPDGGFLLNELDESRASPSARVIVRWPDSLKKKY